MVDIMSRQDRVVFYSFVLLWSVALMQLWLWWLQPEHRVTWIGTILASLLLAWQTFLPAYYFYFVGKMKRPNPVIAIPTEWRVAMVVTKAPSEPWLIVQKTLRACLKQSHLHDTWLADEDPQPETIAWCQKQGVQLSCRKGIAPTTGALGRVAPNVKKATWLTSMTITATIATTSWCS